MMWTGRHALAVQKLLKERYVPEISKISHYDGNLVDPPQPVPWYPDELAWWMTTPKNVIRKFPPFAAFQKFLVSETSVGNISRQEVVSMIPPLCMDLQPGMVVLDLCAAPGSKSAQLLEMVHVGEEARIRKSRRHYAAEDGRPVSPDREGNSEDADKLEVDASDYGRATGLLIANDNDYKRSHMLIHQLKRLSSPNLIVTNHDATMFPSIKLPPSAENPATNRYLKFDRILADVPCSGDGTMRKNVNLWNDWNPGNALGLHVTQVRILVRSLQMLKVGGRVVYSTCSMNPVENEAVLAAAIDRCGGLEKVEILPTDNMLPLLKRVPGLKDWTIMDKGSHVWKNWEDVEEEITLNGPNHYTEKLAATMFPPEDKAIPLERAMRVYAHLQDTGGFFIAVLEKKSEFRARPEGEPAPKPVKKEAAPITAIVEEIESQPAPVSGESVAPKIEAADSLTRPEEGSEVAAAPSEVTALKRKLEDEATEESEAKKVKTEESNGNSAARPNDNPFRNNEKPQRRTGGQQYEEPFKYISGEHEQVKSIETFYKLSPRFPRDRFMVRNNDGEPVKTIYYTSALIRDILTENEGKGIKFIHGGVKMFMKQDVQGDGVCKWRIQSEGIPILEGYVGEERVVRLYKRETLRKLLIEMFPKVTDDTWQNLGEIGERVNKIGMGCCVLRVEPSGEEDGFDERMVLPLWRSMHSLNLMLAKEDRSALLLRLFNDTTPLINNSNPQQREADKKAKEEAEEAKGQQEEEGDKMVLDNDETVENGVDPVKAEESVKDEVS